MSGGRELPAVRAMNAPSVTASWGDVLELLGANGEAKRRAFGVRWDRLDRDDRSLVLQCYSINCCHMVDRAWDDLTEIEQRALVFAALRMARAASGFLG